MFNIQTHKINHQALENQLNQLTCIYHNESEYIQIIRISQPKSAFFEKTVFPNQCVQFAASGDDLLEVWESAMASSVHADTIPCSQLSVKTSIERNSNRAILKEADRVSQEVFALAA